MRNKNFPLNSKEISTPEDLSRETFTDLIERLNTSENSEQAERFFNALKEKVDRDVFPFESGRKTKYSQNTPNKAADSQQDISDLFRVYSDVISDNVLGNDDYPFQSNTPYRNFKANFHAAGKAFIDSFAKTPPAHRQAQRASSITTLNTLFHPFCRQEEKHNKKPNVIRNWIYETLGI